MGGTVNFPSNQAIDTSARLQQAERSGVPVLIPGAFERRAGPVEATEVIADPVAAYARSAEVFDRARRERELEGGGAVRNRTPSRYSRILATIRRWV
jgi:hypothetical protein